MLSLFRYFFSSSSSVQKRGGEGAEPDRQPRQERMRSASLSVAVENTISFRGREQMEQVSRENDLSTSMQTTRRRSLGQLTLCVDGTSFDSSSLSSISKKKKENKATTKLVDDVSKNADRENQLVVESNGSEKVNRFKVNSQLVSDFLF